MANYDYDIGSRIKLQRIKAGLTQKQLGDDLDISVSSVSMYEIGNRKPDYETLVRMADYFGVSTDYLIKGTLASYTESEIFSSLNLEDSTNIDKVLFDLLRKNPQYKVDVEAIKELDNSSKAKLIKSINASSRRSQFSALLEDILKKKPKKMAKSDQ